MSLQSTKKNEFWHAYYEKKMKDSYKEELTTKNFLKCGLTNKIHEFNDDPIGARNEEVIWNTVHNRDIKLLCW